MEELLKLVGAILGARSVKPSDRFAEDLEAESMDLVNLHAAVEEHYDVVLDDELLAEASTVAGLHQVVQAALQ